jgi:hypothetical protein
MPDDYSRALESAEDELAAVEEQIMDLQVRQSQLRSTIAGLRSLLGQRPEKTDESLTDIIRTVLRGDTSRKYMGVDQVMVNARLLGAKITSDSRPSVATILNRLVRNGEVRQGLTDVGSVGFRSKSLLEKMAEDFDPEKLPEPLRTMVFDQKKK